MYVCMYVCMYVVYVVYVMYVCMYACMWRFAKMSNLGLVDKSQFLSCRFLFGLQNYDLSK